MVAPQGQKGLQRWSYGSFDCLRAKHYRTGNRAESLGPWQSMPGFIVELWAKGFGAMMVAEEVRGAEIMESLADMGVLWPAS